MILCYKIICHSESRFIGMKNLIISIRNTYKIFRSCLLLCKALNMTEPNQYQIQSIFKRTILSVIHSFILRQAQDDRRSYIHTIIHLLFQPGNNLVIIQVWKPGRRSDCKPLIKNNMSVVTGN